MLGLKPPRPTCTCPSTSLSCGWRSWTSRGSSPTGRPRTDAVLWPGSPLPPPTTAAKQRSSRRPFHWGISTPIVVEFISLFTLKLRTTPSPERFASSSANPILSPPRNSTHVFSSCSPLRLHTEKCGYEHRYGLALRLVDASPLMRVAHTSTPAEIRTATEFASHWASDGLRTRNVQTLWRTRANYSAHLYRKNFPTANNSRALQ